MQDYSASSDNMDTQLQTEGLTLEDLKSRVPKFLKKLHEIVQVAIDMN